MLKALVLKGTVTKYLNKTWVHTWSNAITPQKFRIVLQRCPLGLIGVLRVLFLHEPFYLHFPPFSITKLSKQPFRKVEPRSPTQSSKWWVRMSQGSELRTLRSWKRNEESKEPRSLLCFPVGSFGKSRLTAWRTTASTKRTAIVWKDDARLMRDNAKAISIRLRRKMISK